MVKKKVFKIDCGTYPFDVLISIGETNKQFINTLSKYIPPSTFRKLDQEDSEIINFAVTTHARTTMFHTGQFVIRFRHMPKSHQDFGMISHELFHIVEILFRKIGMPLQKASSEAYAYLMGHLVTQFYEKL